MTSTDVRKILDRIHQRLSNKLIEGVLNHNKRITIRLSIIRTLFKHKFIYLTML